MTPRWILLAFATALLTGLGCSSGGDGATTMPQLTCSDDGFAPANGVTLRCGGPTGGVLQRADVVIGGPSVGTTTLSGLNFDVVYDPSKLAFVAVTSATSQLFPASALVVGELANGQPGRVVVSIHQVGGALDVTVSPGQYVAMSLSFQLAPGGGTFAPTAVEFDASKSEATDASETITFTGGIALAHQ